MRADYLRELAAYLRDKVQPAVDAKRMVFDMHLWFDLTTGPPKPTLNCHTAACAMGYAVNVFYDRGLEARENGVYFKTKDGRLVDGFEAASALFEISSDAADALFGGESYRPRVQPREVAAAIEAFVDHGELPGYDWESPCATGECDCHDVEEEEEEKS